MQFILTRTLDGAQLGKDDLGGAVGLTLGVRLADAGNDAEAAGKRVRDLLADLLQMRH